jgi:hypothetical protein
MFDTYEKNGKRGKPRGYSTTKGKNYDCDMYDSQGKFAKNGDAERMDLYAKPGTSASKRQSDPYETSYPTSRYRSRRP